MLIYNRNKEVIGFDGPKEFVQFNFLVKTKNLSNTFINKYMDEFDLENLVIIQELNNENLELVVSKIPEDIKDLWDLISEHQNISLEFAKKYFGKLRLSFLYQNESLSTDFWDGIDEFFSYFDKSKLSRNAKLSEKFIETYLLNFNDVYYYNHHGETLTEDFFRRHPDKIKYAHFDVFSDEFIEEYKNDINWDCIEFKDRSHECVRKYRENVEFGCWIRVSEYRDLTPQFVEEFYEDLHPDFLAQNPTFKLGMLKEEDIDEDLLRYDYKYERLTEEEVERYSNKISLYGWEIIANNPYISDEFKNKYNL